MGYSRQEHLSGLPFPAPGDLPDPGIKLTSLTSPALAGRYFTTGAIWEVFCPITSWEIDGATVETVADFIFWAPNSLQMVTAAMKLKDAYSLEGKL